jgi:hypothetical protein
MAEMFGTHQVNVSAVKRKLGIGSGRAHYYRSKFDKEGWIAWCNGVKLVKGDPEKQKIEGITVTEEAKEEPVCEFPVEEPVEFTLPDIFRKAVPNTGSMVYEGKTEDILDSIRGLLGGANVHISITWDVLED